MTTTTTPEPEPEKIRLHTPVGESATFTELSQNQLNRLAYEVLRACSSANTRARR